ncbi:MAG: replicative DNA helicase [Leptospirales bacterium]|nr:replicative DNA helicase [Leptospirales bacterium]
MADVLPSDLEAERQTLGALLLRPDLVVQLRGQLKREDFYSEAHRLIWDAVVALYDQGRTDIDAMQAIHYLEDRKIAAQAGGGPYLLKLVQDSLAPSNAPIYAQRLRALALRRALKLAGEEIARRAAEPNEDENEFLRSIEDQILQLTNSSFQQGIVSVAELRADFVAHLTALVERKGELSGVRTHFTEFDQLTSGLKGGELIILAARPGVGKTTFALNLAANIALKNAQNTLVFSLEMSRLELMMRLVCSEALYSHSELKRGNPGGRQRDLLQAIERICAAPIHIDDSGDLTVWECFARARKFKVAQDKVGQKLGLIVVDYLQLLNDPEARKMGRQHEVAEISRRLKAMARTLDAPVLALSQMNRSVEQRRGESARPQLSDLRESGAIEQDADIVMFIHKSQEGEAESVEDLENRGTVEMILAKHRNGPTGAFRLTFRPELNRFDNRLPPESGAY